MNERRLAARHAQEIDVEVHARQDRVPLRALDVSRHGLFIATDQPAPLHHAVLLTVRLRGGPFECMATVVRRVTASDLRGPQGMGVKLFCLGAAAKERWDRYVASLEKPDLLLPVREATSEGACFLVQLDTVDALSEFFAQNVVGARTLYLSPAIRTLGAPVQIVLVHPETQQELTLEARVAEWSPDHPLRMGIRFEHVDRRGFMRFIGARPRSTSDAPLVAASRPRWTEYAYYSPKVREEQKAEPSPAELDVIEGELLDHPALGDVDKRELFDFHWVNSDED
jgi:hypothetical protein